MRLAAAQPSDHTAAILTFVGAIVVALVAAATAQWRLRVQLRHEDARVSRQLSEQTRQLSEQLVHDRRMADIADLRSVLETTLNEFNEYLKGLQRLAPTMSDAEALSPEALAPLADVANRVFMSGNRLQVRLGGGDRLVDAHARTWGALETAYVTLLNKDRQKFSSTKLDAVEAFKSFVQLCKMKVGSVTDDRG